MSARPGTPGRTTVELPWWLLPLGAPPLLGLFAGMLAGPAPARLAAVLDSLGMLALLVWVALRVASRSMQSVWISAAYAVWVFPVLAWLVAWRTAA